MKKEIKGFLVGVLTTALLFTAVFTASAEPIQKTITAVYSNIKVYVDGKLVQPKDAKGNAIEPFTYNGTTYLPVRAVSDALGKTVDWDAANNSIYIGKKPAQTSGTSAAGTIQTITVGTAQEFVNALGSNRKIVLKPGVYNLSAITQVNNADGTVQWSPVYDGTELNLQNISNLTIEGSGVDKTELKVTPRYANILKFNNCSDIAIKNIKAGHTPAEYECNEGVLHFYGCSNITISGAELYGCGSVGISVYNTRNLSCDSTTIDHCSLRAIAVSSSDTVKFTRTRLINHEAYANIVSAFKSTNVSFEECEISNNHNFSWSLIEAAGNSEIVLDRCKIFNNTRSKSPDTQSYQAYFFKVLDYRGNLDGKITVKNSEINDNTCDFLTDFGDALIFENCKLNNNKWGN